MRTDPSERIDEAAARAALQRRTVVVLMACVVPAGMGMASAFAATAVLGEEITGSDTLGSLAAAFLSIGGVAATVPLARFMARNGRRPGLRLGWTVAAAGAGLGAFAAIFDIYPLLIVGIFGVGVGNATNLSARYAASDLATHDDRARAIGFLVWSGTIGSVAGPSLLGPTGWIAEQVGLPELAGPYLLSVVAFLVSLVLVDRLLRPDPLAAAGRLGTAMPPKRPVSEAFGTMWRIGRARLAVFAMAIGQAVMVGVMTVTPLHMKDGDHELRIIGFVISLHIIGMYALAPVVGWLVDRVGPNLVIAAGGLTLFVGAELASHTDAQDSLGVFVGLFLIGLGWSCGLIAGSALLVDSVPADDQVPVQGASDLVMVGAGALAAVGSGVAVEWSGYHTLSHWAGVTGLALVAAGGWAYIMSTRGSGRPLQV